MLDIFAPIGIFWFLVLLVLAILWICLPFAVFGIKARLDKQNALLAKILAATKANKQVPHVPSDATSMPDAQDNDTAG